jgi:general secretion pathway protein L
MLAGLGAVIFISFLFSGWAQLFAIGKDEDVSAKALAMVTKDVLGEETTSPARARELLAKQTSLSDEDPMPHADAFDVMAKLADVIPSSMVHDIEELDVQKGHVIVHGIVGSIPDAQSIAQSLRSDPCFQEVKITRTTQMVGGDRQKYVLEMDQKCPEDVKTKKKESSSSSAGTVGSAAQGGKEP